MTSSGNIQVLLTRRLSFRDRNAFNEKCKKKSSKRNIFTTFVSFLKGPQNVKMTRPTTEENSGIIRHTGPQNTKYSTLEARLRSFRDWPPALKQEPRQLAEAGFYYIGFSDQTKCFYCDGGLRNWQPEDDPWTEHARWFSKCGFVRLVKGDEFISKCMEERPPESLAPEISKNPRTPTDEEIKSLMSSTVVQQVLSMGVDASRIKSALKRQILKNGQPFSDPNSLVSAALKTDCEAERRPVSLGGAESHQSLSQTQTPNVVVLVSFKEILVKILKIIKLRFDGKNSNSILTNFCFIYRNSQVNPKEVSVPQVHQQHLSPQPQARPRRPPRRWRRPNRKYQLIWSKKTDF